MSVELGLLAWGASEWEALGVWAVGVPAAGYGLWQLRDARRLRREQARPFVVAELQSRSILMILTVHNIGATLARDVCVSLPDGFEMPDGEVASWIDSRAFTTGVATMAPNQRIRFYLGSLPRRREVGLPLRVPVVLKYKGFDGTSYPHEGFVLDMEAFGPALQDDKTMHDLVGEVKALRQEVHKWTDGRGLRVNARDADRARVRELRPMQMVKARELWQSDGRRAAVVYVIREWRRALGLHEWR